MCVGVFLALLGVCVCVGGGGVLIDCNQADFAVVWSYGIVLHPNIMWACLWRSTGVCGCVSGTFGLVWVCVGACGCVWVCGGVLV